MHPRTQEILNYLDQQRAALRSAFDTVPADRRELAPQPDQWSPAGVIEHLAIVEERVGARLTARIAQAREAGIAAEATAEPVLPTLRLNRFTDRSVRLTAPDGVQPTGLGAAAAWDALERAGRTIRETVKGADGLALGTISMPNARFGDLSVYEFVAFLGAHEARHAAQIREMAHGGAKGQ